MVAPETVRQEWEEANRRFEQAARDRDMETRLLAQLEVVLDELRKRVGQSFTLDDLAAAYVAADRWAPEAVEERAATAGWPRHLADVQGAAFYMYQRGAVDYAP